MIFLILQNKSFKGLTAIFLVLSFVTACKRGVSNDYHKENQIFNKYLTENFPNLITTDKQINFIIIPSTSCESCENFIVTNLKDIIKNPKNFIIIPSATVDKYEMPNLAPASFLVDKYDKITRLNLGFRNVGIVQLNHNKISKIIIFDYKNIHKMQEYLE